MKYSLSPREIPKAKLKQFPEVSGYCILQFLTRVTIQTFSITNPAFALEISFGLRLYFSVYPSFCHNTDTVMLSLYSKPSVQRVPEPGSDRSISVRRQHQLLRDCLTFRLSHRQTFRLSDFQTFTLPDCHIIRLSDFQTVRFSGSQLFRPSDSLSNRLSYCFSRTMRAVLVLLALLATSRAGFRWETWPLRLHAGLEILYYT